MRFVAGDRVGPYEITGTLGSGGMGEVYRAHDNRLGRDVAIKVLPGAFSRDAERLRRFEQEARATGLLNHPNILAIYDIGTQDGAPYVVSELLEGQTLREVLANGALPIRTAIDYAKQIANGLAAAHEKGVVHRDLKPENLFVTRDARLKILDFGLAKLTAPEDSSRSALPTMAGATDAGVVLGTVGYMSPEQVRGESADARSDIFSFGVVFYEMLSGRRAFQADTAVETLSAILKEEPPELSATHHAVPASVEAILRHCLEKKVERRFQTSRDLAFSLDSLSGSSVSVPPAIALPARKARLPLVAALLLFVIACVSAYILGRRGAASPNNTAAVAYKWLTFRRGIVTGARFANGGKTIVYSAAWDGNASKVFVTQPESPEFRPLGIENANVLAISSTGQMAVLLGSDSGLPFLEGTLAQTSVSGGAPRKISEHVTLADWSPDGSALAVVRNAGKGQRLEYPIGKPLYETTGMIDGIRISPHGDLIALLDNPIPQDTAGYVVVIDAQGNRKAASKHWASTSNGFVWSPDGSEVWFIAGDASGVILELRAMDLAGHERLVTALPDRFTIDDISPDGRLLMRQALRSGMFLVERAGEAKSTDLYWHDGSTARGISSDGKTLLFSEGAAAAPGDFQSYIRGIDGSPAVHIGAGLPMALSPDGNWAITNPAGRPAQLMLLPTGAGESRPLTKDGIHHIAAGWTPDGKQIVFVGNEPNHGLRYFVQGLEPGAVPQPITQEGIPFSREALAISPDGRSIAVVDADRKIQLQPLDGSAARPMPNAEPADTPLRWCGGAGSGSLLVVHYGEFPTRIFQIDLETGKRSVWKELAPANRTGLENIGWVVVSPDCKAVAYSAGYNLGTEMLVDGLVQPGGKR